MTFNLINSIIPNFRVGPSLPPEEVICNGPCGLRNINVDNPENIATVIIRIANLLVYIAVPIAVIMLIWTGFMMLIGQVKNPITAILNIFIGLGIIVVSFYLTDGFANLVKDAPVLLDGLFNSSN